MKVQAADNPGSMKIGKRELRASPSRVSGERQASQDGEGASGSGLAEVFVGRQPIFDRRLKVVGYELLFRDGSADSAVVVDQEGATATVVLNSITEIGFEQIIGGRAAWVNVSCDFMRKGLVQLLPPAPLVLEILEDQAIDDEVIATVAELKRRGRRLALDDFIYTPDTERLLGLVDFVKLDLLALGRDGLSRMITRLAPYGVRLVAEKLETQEDYAFCAQAGCELFQGYFFCRPELMRGRRIDANRAALLDLLAALHNPEAELADLTCKIAVDVGLSFRLLRYINSAFFGLRQQVRSIGQAVALPGLEHLKQWATLTVFTSVDDKPAELTITALVRARFCEQAAQNHLNANRNEMFTLGLFSLIDALFDTPMVELLDMLPLAPDVCDALVQHKGPKGRLLECLDALETGDLDKAEAILPAAGQLYISALAWAAEITERLFGH
jgi:EAL and modified HD-GYP domain-containing signal transduction protein